MEWLYTSVRMRCYVLAHHLAATAHVFVHLLCAIIALWKHMCLPSCYIKTLPCACMCIYVCHVPVLSHGGMGMPVLIWCVQIQPLSNVGVPVCTPAVFRHYLMMTWHTCPHTYLVPAPTHDVTGSSVLTSAKFQCYQVVVQVCLLARQPYLSDSMCWYSTPPFSSAIPQCH